MWQILMVFTMRSRDPKGGPKGMVLGSYLRCLGRVMGQKGVFLRDPGAHLFVFSMLYAFEVTWVSESKRDVLEGARGAYLCVLKVVCIWTVLGGFEWFWVVLGSDFGNWEVGRKK